MTKNPLVSIIITSYNYGHYLADAIESALRQTYQNLEVIVVDDYSTDNTKNIVNQYPVHYFYQRHQGVAIARNNGIKQSHGEFFVCLDGDDKLAPEYIRKTMEQIMKNPKIGFVYTGTRTWNEKHGIENIWMPHKIYTKYALFAGWTGVLGCALFRRAVFDDLDYAYDPHLPAYEDLDVCFRLLLKGWRAAVVFEPLHWYRIHENSLNPVTDEKIRYATSFLNRKYWFRKPYRMFYALYKNTLGRAASLIGHPIEYLKGIKEKIKVNIWTNSYHWANPINRKKAQKLTREILFTIDMLIEWSSNKVLRDYYMERLKNFESRLLDVLKSDFIEKKENLL